MSNQLGLAIERYIKDNNMTRQSFLYKINRLFDKPVSMSALGFWITGKREPRQKEREILYSLLDYTFNGVARQKFKVISNETLKDEYIDINTNLNDPIHSDKCFVYKKNNMLPLISNGDTLFIDDNKSIENTNIILLEIEKDFVAKRIYVKDDICTLCDENNNSPPMIFNKNEFNKIKQLGVITYILKKV